MEKGCGNNMVSFQHSVGNAEFLEILISISPE